MKIRIVWRCARARRIACTSATVALSGRSRWSCVPARRRHRFDRAHHRRLAFAAVRAAGGRREPSGRERRDRRRIRRTLRARRLYALLRGDAATRGRAVRAEDLLRPGERLCADLHRGHQPVRARLQREDPGEEPRGVRRLREGAARGSSVLPPPVRARSAISRWLSSSRAPGSRWSQCSTKAAGLRWRTWSRATFPAISAT